LAQSPIARLWPEHLKSRASRYGSGRPILFASVVRTIKAAVSGPPSSQPRAADTTHGAGLWGSVNDEIFSLDPDASIAPGDDSETIDTESNALRYIRILLISPCRVLHTRCHPGPDEAERRTRVGANVTPISSLLIEYAVHSPSKSTPSPTTSRACGSTHT